MRLGCHVGISGGLDKALERAVERGCETVQIFISNPRGWRHTPPTPAAAEHFRAGCREADIHPVFVHTIYLINLATTSEDVYGKSLESLVSNVQAAGLIGAEGVVTHLGSHRGEGEQAGLNRILAALESALAATPGGPAILLETTAGAGNAMGTSFEHLGRIIEAFRGEGRLGVCVDTCHVFAAGYEVRTREGLDRTLEELDRAVGLERVRLVHANDSRGGRGSQLDRHEHIGRGEIGLEGFHVMARDPFLRQLPWILETPADSVEADRANLGILHEAAKD
jgi:deoxyribonuclease-4